MPRRARWQATTVKITRKIQAPKKKEAHRAGSGLRAQACARQDPASQITRKIQAPEKTAAIRAGWGHRRKAWARLEITSQTTREIQRSREETMQGHSTGP